MLVMLESKCKEHFRIWQDSGEDPDFSNLFSFIPQTLAYEIR